ncbi:MAG TPA: type VI secretion system protein TssA [Candidatus Angelobacter sp.]|nr:type VI secretion system protein TssA [Candidatus Angelobacter sp.]
MSLLREDLLTPLPGDPKGENLRYAPVYDKIKEARQEDEDDSPQGDWQRPLKRADFAAVLKLAGEALATKSKDLQLAAWLSEAAIRREGFGALPECIKLMHELQVRFWDVLYPELEDGNPEFRATPQEWFSSRCDYLLRRVPLTKKGPDWLRYKESRSVGYEEAANDDDKKQRREEAIADGKLTAEDFDEAFTSTPKAFYVATSAHLEGAEEALAALESFCDEKYGNVAPSFAKLRSVLVEVKQTADILLHKKRELEPDPVAEEETIAAEEEPVIEQELEPSAPVVAAPRRPSASLPQNAPTSAEEAGAVIAQAAECLRKLDPSAVAPYLLSRSLRWGELRSAGDSPDPMFLVAPATDVRQTLKRLSLDSNWDELLNAAEAAVASPCGRAWLDLHRYTWRASSELGYSAVAKAICSEVRSLLHDFPDLPSWVLADDTPTANPETNSWLQEYVIVSPKVEESAPIVQIAPSTDSVQNGSPDQFEAAAELARNGRLGEAMEILSRPGSHENSGREKFLRQLRVSQLCLSTGNSAIAYPILQSLFAEIQRRGLLEWESTSFNVQPLALLVQCIDKTGQDAQQRSQIYDLLCRLEPTVALQLQHT